MSGFLEAWDKRLFGHLMQRLLRASFMIINELGFRHLDRTGGKLLFNLRTQRYKRWCERAIEDDCLEMGVWIYLLAEKKRFTALYGRVLWRSWSYFADSWNNAKICLNCGESFPSLRERKQSCGYMDNSPLRSELPTYPQHYCYYFFYF